MHLKKLLEIKITKRPQKFQATQLNGRNSWNDAWTNRAFCSERVTLQYPCCKYIAMEKNSLCPIWFSLCAEVAIKILLTKSGLQKKEENELMAMEWEKANKREDMLRITEAAKRSKNNK